MPVTQQQVEALKAAALVGPGHAIEREIINRIPSTARFVLIGEARWLPGPGSLQRRMGGNAGTQPPPHRPAAPPLNSPTPSFLSQPWYGGFLSEAR